MSPLPEDGPGVAQGAPPCGSPRTAETKARILRCMRGAADPWDSGFNFVDPVLEAAYWEGRVRRNLWAVDMVSHLNCALMAFGLLSPLRAASAPAYLTCLLLPAWIVLRAAMSLWSFETGENYLVWRSWAISGVRLAFAFLGAAIGSALPPPEPSSAAVLVRIVTCSMVIGLVATSAGLQLKTTVGIRVQFVATTLSMIMAPGYCAAGLDGDKFAAAFQAIGGSIDGVMRYVAFGLWGMDLIPRSDTDSLGASYSCWAVVSFVQWALGFFLTSLVVFCIEGWSRLCFVAEHVGPEAHLWRRLSGRWLGSACVAVVVAVVGCSCVWELLRMVEQELGHLGSCTELERTAGEGGLPSIGAVEN